MTIEHFTPVAGLVGGALIGLSAGTLLLMNGDILGASGIVSTVCLNPLQSLRDPQQHWKFVLLASFLLVTALQLESSFDMTTFAMGRTVSDLGYLVGGLFVGFGTKLGNGCTSGHGICGLARLSKRSFTAVMTFMLTAIITSHITKNIPQLNNNNPEFTPQRLQNVGYILATFFAVLALFVAPLIQTRKDKENNKNNTSAAKLAPAAISGLLFAVGLHKGTMVYPSKVIGFLNVYGIMDENTENYWDPTLMCVMGAGLIVSMLSYQLIPDFSIVNTGAKLSTPLACQTKDCAGFKGVPRNQTIDWQLVVGAICFGIGWGIAGICPGPAVYMAGIGMRPALFFWWPAFLFGSYMAVQVKQAMTPNTTTTTTSKATSKAE